MTFGGFQDHLWPFIARNKILELWELQEPRQSNGRKEPVSNPEGPEYTATILGTV